METELIYINKEQLVTLLNKAYLEGCYGYIDLKDSAVYSIAEEYLAEQQLKLQRESDARACGTEMKFSPYSYVSAGTCQPTVNIFDSNV